MAKGTKDGSCFRDRWRDLVASADGPSSATTRHVLLTLSLHMDTSGGQCFPSTRYLAESTKLSERVVCRHLDLGMVGGWVSKNRRPGASGQGWRRNEYQATLPKALTQGQHVTPKGTDAGSARLAEGTDPNGKKALTQGQSNQSKNQRTTYTCPPDFERVWIIHHRGSKSAALKEWRKAVPDLVDQEDLERCLTAYISSFNGDFKGAHLFRWIRDRRWEELSSQAPPRNQYPSLRSQS